MQNEIVVPGLQHPEMIDQVRRGMQLLDGDRPGWEHLVYLPDLDICSPCTCVLGQVYREVYDVGFMGAIFHLFGILWMRKVPNEEYQQLVDHGFAVDRRLYGEEEAAKLQLESVWKVLIGQRTGVEGTCPNDHENIPGTVFCKECGESLREEVNW